MIGEVIWALGMVAWYVIRRPFERKGEAAARRAQRAYERPRTPAGFAAAIIGNGRGFGESNTCAFDWPPARLLGAAARRPS